MIAVEGRSIFTLGARGIAGERQPAGVTLTDTGWRFLNHAYAILSSVGAGAATKERN